MLDEEITLSGTNPGSSYDIEYVWIRGFDLNDNPISPYNFGYYLNVDYTTIPSGLGIIDINGNFTNTGGDPIIELIDNNTPITVKVQQTSNVRKLEIYQISRVPGQNPQDPARYFHLEPTEINLVARTDNLINIEPNEQGCITYNNFSFNLDIELDGFCATQVYANIKLDPNYITNPNDPSNTFEYFPIGSTAPPLQQWSDYCNDPNNGYPAAEGPDPIPFGCRDYEVELVILPCDDASVECINAGPWIINKTIQICCSCDIRTVVNH